MSRSNRGFVSRAASALMFCAAAAALLVFPEGEAGSARSGFAPAQVPPVGETAPDEFRRPDLCRRLGGNVRPEDGGSVCSQVDQHGTFCIIGSADIFPCRGLLKRVILCNAEYNRPALNPFLCGIRCAPGAEKARGAKCEAVAAPDLVLPVRAVAVFAAEGYAGAAHRADVAEGFTLEFSETAAAGLTLAAVPSSNDFDFVLAPLRASLAATLTALIRRANYYPDDITLAAAFNPVFAPPPQRVSAIYDDDFALTLQLPANFGENATLTLASVSPPAALTNFQLISNTITRASPEDTPNAGGYAMNVEMTHPDFLGTLTMAATATISQRGIFAEGLELLGRFTVTVAFGHTGEVFRATISRPELNLEFARHDPDFFLESYLAGLTVTLSRNLQTAVFSLTEPLASETGLPPRLGTPQVGLGFAYFYVRRQDRSPNYQEVGLFVDDYRVTTLNQPPVVDVVQTVAFSAGTVFFDFADASYEGGVYAGATFTDASGGGGNQLILRPDGKIEAGAGLTEFGNYAITVEAVSPNAENFVGTARLTFRLNYEPPDLRVVPHDEVLAQREVTIYAAENYEGPAHFVDVGAGYTLEFGERSGGGYTLAARGENDAEFVLTSPLRAPVNVALMPLISCSGCSSRPLTLSASFRPVAAPEQARLESVYDSEFTLTLAPPENYRQNFAVSIANISPDAGANFEIVSNTLITRPDGATPDAGEYVLNLEMTHPEFLGTLAIPITANIARKIPSDEPDLKLIGKFAVTVAFGHTGEVIRATILNPNFKFGRHDFSELLASLPEDHQYRRDIEEHYLIGLTIALSPNRLTARLIMTAALEAGETLPPASGGDDFALLYVLRQDENPNYTDYGLFIRDYKVDTLDPPPVVSTLIRGALSAQQVFHNFGASSYANGDYVGATFSEEGGAEASPALNVRPDGAVVAPGLTESGTYAVTVLAVSPDEENFVGTARMTFTLTYEAPRAIDADDALARRDVTVYAVAGHSGPAHSVNVADGFTLNFSRTIGANFTLAARLPNDFEFELAPLLSTVNTTLTADIECDNCLPASLTLSAAFHPVSPPSTQGVAARYNDDFAVILQYPPGFGENATLSLAEISPPAALTNFQLVSNTITRASPELTPDAGEYAMKVAMTHPNLLGTLTMAATVSIARGIFYEEGLELRGRFTVTVAFGHAGEVFHATISNPNADLDLEFGRYDFSVEDYLTGLTIALSPDRQTATFSLTDPLAAGTGFSSERDGFALLNVRRADGNANYREESLFLEYRVTTLNEPPPVAILRGGQTPIAAGEELFNFGAADYADGAYVGATFAEQGGEDASPNLNVDAGGAVAAAGELQTGTYDITVLADNEENFVGTARMTFTITYEAPRVPAPAEALAVRTVTVYAAAGYSGPAHSVNVESGFTLNFSPRSGTGFTLAARAPNDFEFELLTLLAPVEEVFTAPVDCAFCLPSTLTLSASFLPVFAPEQPPLRTTRGADVAHALVPPTNFAFDGADLSLHNSPGFSLVDATLGIDPFLPPLSHRTTAFVVMTDPGLLGTVTLAVETRIFRLDAAGVSAFCESEPEGFSPGVLSERRGNNSELAGNQCVFSDGRETCYGPDLTQDIANSAGINTPLCDDLFPDCASGTEDLDGNPLTNDCHNPADFVVVGFSESPPDRSGGTLVVTGPTGATLFSGRRRLDGTQMRFVATPAGTHYVSLWAGAPSQCLAGDSSVPGDSRECLIPAADGLDITVFFGEFFPQIRAVVELSGGASGSASVEGLENGAKVSLGTTVTFIAAPDSKSYVSGWSRAECLDVGDGDNPGVEKKCILVANENLIVTATLLPPPSLQTVFYGNTYENAGDTDTILSTESPHLPVDASAEFLGIRRGLAMMQVTGDGADWTRDVINAGNFENIRDFCEEGGFGWRLPNFSEAAGIVFSPAGGQSRVETVNSVAHIPGLPFNMPVQNKGEIVVDFPPRAEGEAAVPSVGRGVVADLLAVINGVTVRPVYFPAPSGNNAPQASVGSTDTLGLICVRTFDESYSRPENIAGIEVNGLTVSASGTLTLTMRAAPQTPEGENYGTITLSAWRFADDGSRALANVDISYNADLASVAVLEDASGRKVLGLRPESGDFAVATIIAHPPVGRTITARVELTMDAARIVFNGETIRQLNQDVNVSVPLSGVNESMSVRMSYHGIRRGIHILRSEAWRRVRDGGTQTLDSSGRFSGADYGTEALAAKICGRDGWRIPTVGEIVGASAPGNDPFLVEFVGGRDNEYDESPAGGRAGLSIPMRPLGGNDAGPAADEFHEVDSRTASGNYVAVRYLGRENDIRFPSINAARWIMCALDAEENIAPLPQLAAVRLESEGEIIGNPVASSANTNPSFNISITVAPVAEGEVVFVGTVVAWKHKDNPTVIANARPEVVSTGGGAEFAASFENAAGNYGTEIRVSAAAEQSSALQTTLSLWAAHSLGVSAAVVFDIEVLPGGFAASYEARSTRSGTSEVIGELTATLQDGAAVAPDGNVGLGANVYAVATPRAGYYVHSWTGACVGAETGDAAQAGEAKTCVVRNVRAALNFGAVFARDECAASSPCDPQNATCSDPNHLEFGTALTCACAADFTTDDNGRACVSAIVTVVYTPAPTGGRVSAFFDGGARNGQLIPSGETISTLRGIGASVAAVPDADYYVHSWTGACDKPDSQTGDASQTGAAQSCELAANELGEFGALFGRDECATNNGGCDALATCADANHLADDSAQCACPSGYSTTDNGQTCLRPVPAADSVPANERTARVYVSPTYSGSVAFFHPRNSAVSLQTPSAAPTGFEFSLNESFSAPDGITVGISAPLGNGGTLSGEWVATAGGAGYLATQVPLRVEVSALAALSESWTGAAPASGALLTLTVFGFANAQFFSTMTGASLSVSQGGEVGAPTAINEEGEHLLSGWAEHDDFLGRLPFQVNAIVGQGGLFTVVFTAAPVGGAVSVYLDGGARDGSAVNSGDVISTLQGAGLSVDAVPDADYYVFRWTGACAGSQAGNANQLGAAQECVLAAGALGELGAEFGRDECATNNGGCSALATCADSSHATDGDAQCQCPADYSTSDNGRTCIVSAENVDLENVIPSAARRATVYVAPAYVGSVAFFRSALAGVTLQTPAAAPAGFAFPTDAGFVGPDSGVTVELSLPLETGGVVRRGEFVLTVRLSAPGFADPQITLGVIASAVAPIAESWRGDSGASGALLTLSVSGFPNARFFSTMTGSSLAVSQSGAVSAPAALAAGTHLLEGWAEHDNFLGRLPFRASANAGFCERPDGAQTSPYLQEQFSVLMDALDFAHEHGDDTIAEISKDGACDFIVSGADPTPELARNAAIAGRTEVLEFLAGLKDTDVNAYNNSPWGTPLDLAVRTGNDGNARVLRRAGAGCAAVATSDKCAANHPDYAGLPPVDADALILPAGRNLTVTTGRQQASYPAPGWPEVSIVAENAALHVRASRNVGTFLTRPGRAVQMGYYYPHVGQTESGHITLQVAQKGKRPGAVRIDFEYEALAHIYLHVDDDSPGADFYDLRTDSGEAALANATLFIPGSDNPPEFQISDDGLVSGPETFSDTATLYFFAHSDNYVGIAIGRLDINPIQARPLNPDEVLRNRSISVTVLVGHTGPVHNFAFRAAAYRGYFVDLDSAPTVFAGGGASRVDGEIRIPAERPMAGEERRVEMTLDVSCRFCGADDEITVAANLIPLHVTLQPQPTIRVTARSVYERGFNLPEGFGSNDGVVNIPAGRPEAAYFNVRGSVIYSQGRLEEYFAPAGTYVFPVHFRSHFRGPSFVGTVTLTLTLENIGIPLADLGIPQGRLLATVTVAPGFAGTVYAVAPADERVRNDCAFARVYGGLLMNAQCELIRPPGAAGGHAASVVITETLDPYHETRLANLRLSVRQLPAPPASAAEQILYQSDSAHDFSSFGYAAGAYADAEFSQTGESPYLGVEPDGRVFTRGVLYAGNYGITVLARSPDFLGAAALTFSLAVLDPANPGIPAGLLNASVYVADGYLGEIHRLTPALDSTEVSCDPADGTANIAVSAECVFSLTGGSGARSVELDAAQTPAGRAAETARAAVVAMEIPPPEGFTTVIVEGTPVHRGEEDLFNLTEWTVDGRTFAARFPRAQFAVFADDAGAFSVSPDGRARMSAARALGGYRATIHAFSNRREFRGTVAFDVAVTVGRLVLSEDSVPTNERFFVANIVPGYRGTLWSGAAANSEVGLTLIRRAVAGAQRYFYDPLAVVDDCGRLLETDEGGNLKGTIAPKGLGNEIFVPATCMGPDDVHDPVSDAINTALNSALRYDAAQGAVLLRATCGEACLRAINFRFNVVAFRPGLWVPSGFQVGIRAALLSAKDETPRNAAHNAADAVGKVLMTFNLSTGLSAAQFAEVSDSANLFTVSQNGEVRLSGASAPAAGIYEITVMATAPPDSRGVRMFYGTVQASAKIRFVSAGGIAFAGAVFSDDGDKTTVNLSNDMGAFSNSYSDGSNRIETPYLYSPVYRGIRRGLHWVESEDALENKTLHRDQRGLPERLCQAGGAHNGKKWRLPTLSEVAGILSDGTGNVVLAENNHDWLIPGAAPGMAIPLPSVARGGDKNLTGDAYVVSPLDRTKGGKLAPVSYELDGTTAKLNGFILDTVTCPGDSSRGTPPGHRFVLPGGGSGERLELCPLLGAEPRMACVLETDSFSATPPLLGVRLSGGGISAGGDPSEERAPQAPVAAQRALAGVISQTGAFLTMTASAWRYFARPQTRVAARDVRATLTRSISGAGFAADFSDLAGGGVRAVVRLTETPAFDLQSRAFTLSFAPEFGATLRMQITAQMQAPPVTRAQEEAALPPAERGRALRVAVGYSGDLLTITSHASPYNVLLPQGSVGDGLGLRSISGGAVLTVSEISLALDSRAASFTVTVSVVGLNQRATVSLSYSVGPLQAPIMEPVRLAGEDASGATVVDLKEGEFAAATFAKISGDAGLSVKAATGEVIAEERAWTDGGYNIVVGASDADSYIGQVQFTVSLIVGVIPPVVFTYGHQDVRSVGDIVRVNDVYDENGANRREFSMTYVGARRGLHWMETTEAASTSHQRDICLAGERGGRDVWRVPTSAEIAGLLLDGTSAEIGAATPAENGAFAGAVLSLAARAPADETLSGLSQGPFFADFLLNGGAALAEEDGGKLNLSGEGGEGRYLCVLAAENNYQIPPRLAGIRVENGGDSQYGAGAFSFRHGRTAVGEEFRVSLFAYHSPLSGRADAAAASLQVEIVEKGSYVVSVIADPQTPGFAEAVLETPGALAETTITASFRASPPLGATVALSITVVAFADGGRPVLSEDSIPVGERFVDAYIVPGYAGTLWSAIPANAETELTLIQRAIAGAQRYFYDPLAVVDDCGRLLITDGDGNLMGTIPPKDDQGTPADCANPGDVHDPNSDAINTALNSALRYDAAQNAVLLRSTCEAFCISNLNFRFNVQATRPGLAWDPALFAVGFRGNDMPEANPVNIALDADDAPGQVLFAFALPAGTGGEFSEESDSANLFTVARNGEVRLSGSSAPAAGTYHITVIATASANARGVRRFYGTVRTSAQIRLTDDSLAFAGVGLASAGDETGDVNVANDFEDLSDYQCPTNDAGQCISGEPYVEIPYVYNAIYRGIRRGLHWVETETAIENDEFYDSQRGLPQRLCAAGGESGGKQWRLPTLSEVAGILSDGTGAIALAEVNRDYEIPGAAVGMSVPLPSVARGGGANLTGDAFVVSPLDRNRVGRIAPVMYEFAGGQAKLHGHVRDNAFNCLTINNTTRCAPPGFEYVEGGGVGSRCESTACLFPRPPLGPDARIACVLETDSAAATPPLLGARVEANGRALAGGALALTAKAPTTPSVANVRLPGVLTAAGPIITVRAVGWNFRDNNARVAVNDHPGAAMSLSVRAPEGFSVQIENSGQAVVHADEAPNLYAEADISIAAWPPFGATVSVVMRFATGGPDEAGPPVSNAQLAALLPAAQRNVRVLVPAQNADLDPATAPGFTGAVHRLVPGAAGTLFFAPAESAGMTLLANGVVSITAALDAADGAQTAVFSLTAKIEGRRRTPFLISVTAEPISVETIQREVLTAESAGVLFDLPALSTLLADAAEFRRVAGAFLRVNSAGMVVSDPAGGLTPRDAPYEIVVGAMSPAHLGELFFRVRLGVSHPPFSESERDAAIPAAARSVFRAAASGYSGALKLTLFSRDSQTELDFPSPAPTGFSVDSAGRVSLASAFTGERIAGVFQITARRDERENAVIPVEVAVGPPQTPTLVVARFDPQFSGALNDFGAGDLSGAVFSRDASSDSELALSAEGVLSAPNPLAEGTYRMSGSAAGGLLLGVIFISAVISVEALPPPVFAGTSLTAAGVAGFPIFPLCDRGAASASCEKRLHEDQGGEGMVYHGLRRGLHWVVNTQLVPVGSNPPGLWTPGSARLYIYEICPNGGTHDGRTWRLPTLGELAGAYVDSNAAGFLTLSTVWFASRIPGAAAGVQIPYRAGSAADAGALPLADGALQYYSQMIEFGAGTYAAQSPASPSFILTGDGEARLSSSTNATQGIGIERGGLVCVLETEGYEGPASLLGVRARSGGEVLIGELASAANSAPELEARVSAPAVSSAGAVYTLTVTGWRHASGEPPFPNPPNFSFEYAVEEELPDAPLTTRLAGDTSGASRETRLVSGEGTEVILRLDSVPTSERVLQLNVWPEVGLTVSIFVTVR